MLPSPSERPVISADEAFAVLGIDRTTGYRAIRDGTFPLPVIRVGRVFRIPTVPLVRMLTGDDAPPNAERRSA
jgi:predicted site-specific integrase-resolvase